MLIKLDSGSYVNTEYISFITTNNSIYLTSGDRIGNVSHDDLDKIIKAMTPASYQSLTEQLLQGGAQ